MGIKSILLAVMAVILSTSVNAAMVTQGALSSYDDGTSNIITDTLNQREYLRFDVLASLTYAQTLNSLNTQDGGGWTIAGETDALKFVNAFFEPATHDCDGTLTQTCGSSSSWYDGKFGDSNIAASDVVWFSGTDNLEVGYIAIIASNKDVVVAPSWNTIAESDKFSASGEKSTQLMSWLVYRDVSPVPIPAAAWLFGSGLLGLVGMARRKKA